MPNWCFGYLKVNCKRKDSKLALKEFEKFAKGKDEGLVTEKFIPYPKKRQQYLDKWKNKKKTEFENGDNDWFNAGNGYDWCCQNWGTKWGICHSKLMKKEYDRLEYTFDTAWSPCLPVIQKMSEMFPHLEFIYKYWESGMGFRGYFKVKKGQILENKQYKYNGYMGG